MAQREKVVHNCAIKIMPQSHLFKKRESTTRRRDRVRKARGRTMRRFNPFNQCRHIRLFSTTRISRLFNLELEQTIRSKIDSLPKLENIYVNPDGSLRKPSDSELQTIAQLNTLAEQRSLSLLQLFLLPKEHEELYADNLEDLETFNISSNRIVDKIPYEDPKTGEVKWKVVRANEKEGWENVSYYFYVPLLILLVAVLIFKNDDSIDSWAEKELMLRLKENAEEGDTSLLDALDRLAPEKQATLSRRELNERDSVIIERILSGQYDNLIGLKIKQQSLTSGQGSESQAQ